MLDSIIKVFQYLFGRKQTITLPDDSFTKQYGPPVEPKVHFEKLTVVNRTPSNDTVDSEAFITVVYEGRPIWALFRCPCGCGTVISLSLQKVHNPNWTVEKTSTGRPTIYPSVWQNKGCYSHFWIRDGRVYWCHNTGTQPWVAEPSFYSKPAKSKGGSISRRV